MNNFLSHDVLNMAQALEFLHEHSALSLDSAEGFDLVSEFMYSMVGVISDSVAFSSEVGDDLLKPPAHFLRMVPFFFPFMTSLIKVLILLVPFLDLVLKVIASGLEISHVMVNL